MDVVLYWGIPSVEKRNYDLPGVWSTSNVKNGIRKLKVV